jgi:hypothetical protein
VSPSCRTPLAGGTISRSGDTITIELVQPAGLSTGRAGEVADEANSLQPAPQSGCRRRGCDCATARHSPGRAREDQS